ncbi:MAG: glucokinase [Oceanobacter sp.]
MTWLVADVGGTNARFALVENGSTEISQIISLPTSDYASLEQAAEDYLSRIDAIGSLSGACFALACPVHQLPIQMTNLDWMIAPENLAKALNISAEKVLLINDFTAQAMAMVSLPENEFIKLSGSTTATPANQQQQLPQLVVGPGTGLGVAGLIPGESGSWQVLATEGGHISYAVQHADELPVLEWFQQRHGRVSVERLLCGDGLLALYEFEAFVAGVESVCNSPAQVSEMAENGNATAVRAVDRFLSILGSTVGDLTLALGAWGGVNLCGGILPKMSGWVDWQSFHENFGKKGRYSAAVSTVPVRLCMASQPGLVGTAAWMAQAQAELTPAIHK